MTVLLMTAPGKNSFFRISMKPTLKSATDFSTKSNYAVIRTGYTSRLAKKNPCAIIPDFLCDADGCKPVLLKDKMWGDAEAEMEGETIVQQEDVDLVKRFLDDCKIDGVLAYKNASASDCLEIINELGELGYCAGCAISNIQCINTYELDGKSFIVIVVDASSG